MVDYLLNTKNRVLHKRVDGRVLEICNTDQLTRVQVFDVPQTIYTSRTGKRWKVHPCKRCFPDGVPS